MNAAASGINVPPTRPLSRAERRAEAARVQAEQAAAERAAAEQADRSEPDHAAEAEKAGQPEREEHPVPESTNAPAVLLQPRKKHGKRPFATQLRPSTLARLEWIMARGYVITDTVDDAINAYLDAAGIPRPDTSDRMPD